VSLPGGPFVYPEGPAIMLKNHHCSVHIEGWSIARVLLKRNFAMSHASP
jgi:hypothetical protein